MTSATFGDSWQIPAAIPSFQLPAVFLFTMHFKSSKAERQRHFIKYCAQPLQQYASQISAHAKSHTENIRKTMHPGNIRPE
jgi:hypothetical protein